MAGVTIEFNAQDALDALIKIESALDDTQSLFSHMGEVLLDIHNIRFDAQQSPDGVPWDELSLPYIQVKPKNKDKILTLDGVLRSTLHYQIEGNTLLFGTNVIYGATHQFGRVMPFKGRMIVIPARPWLGVSAKDELLLADVAREHLGLA